MKRQITNGARDDVPELKDFFIKYRDHPTAWREYTKATGGHLPAHLRDDDDNPNFRTHLQYLCSEDEQEEDFDLKVITLKILIQRPTALPFVIECIRRLLENKTVCELVSGPVYGELRYLAAHALAAEYALLGIAETVTIRNTFLPIPWQTLAKLVTEHSQYSYLKIKGESEVRKTMDTLLRDHKIPTFDLELTATLYDDKTFKYSSVIDYLKF